MPHLLVIGNGFDLDLGLKTSFSHFAESCFWPFSGTEYQTPLGEFLNRKKSTQTWLDLERALGDYAEDRPEKRLEETGRHNRSSNMSDFAALVSGLSNYLDEAQSERISETSAAARLLKSFLRGFSEGFGDGEGYPDYEIVSFNYTDLGKYAEALGCNVDFPYSTVHGSLKNNDIVLGFGDSTNARPDSEFMRKSFNENYRPVNFLPSLNSADNIIFFGLSFGEIDYAYFDEFFTRILGPDDGSAQAKRMTFITRDEESRLSILRNLHERTGHKVSSLISKHSVRFIRTHNNHKDDSKLEECLKEIDDSVEEIIRLKKELESIGEDFR